MRHYIIAGLLMIGIVTNNFSQVSQKFYNIELVSTTKLKDQQSSGTCWSFATTSFLETEALRLGKKPISLSPIFFVSPTYLAKAERYIEKNGDSYFDAGDLTFNVLKAYKKYGAVPEEVYNGVIEGDWQHDHLEMDNLLYAMVESVGNSGYGRIKPNSWKKSFKATLTAYLGETPVDFQFQGAQYNPVSFAKKFVGIDPDNYVEITSYSHLPFNDKSVVLDIPANWDENHYLNVSISDFEQITNSALENGYSLAWDGDATEDTFNFEKGIAKLTEQEEKEVITQEQRQSTFEDKSTTDDHNMHIIGRAEDGEGRTFYVLKNSEGDNKLGGYIYMSRNAFLLKTISILVCKDAIPSEIKKKTFLMNEKF